MRKSISIITVIALIAVIAVILVFNKKRSFENTQLASEASTSITVGMDEVREGKANLSFASNVS